MNIDETNPHYKFAKYWEAIGRPQLETLGIDWSDASIDPCWFEEVIYRIKGDRHWQLRREWVDSGFTLPIEYQINKSQWWLLGDVTKNCNFVFSETVNYRKAKTKQEQTLPTLFNGKRLELIDVPISTLSECLAALATGYVLESSNGFHFLDGNMFGSMGDSGYKQQHIDFYFQTYFAAYKLVDAPWWESIPDGGVLCQFNIGIFLVVGFYHDTETAIINRGNGNEGTGIDINRYVPVTDEWLESMKRGF